MYNFIDPEDPVNEEEQQTRARRLAQYSVDALKAGLAAEQVYVMFTEFKEGLDACDRIFQLARYLETPQGLLISGPPGSAKTTLANYFMHSLPPGDLFEAGFGAIKIRLRHSPAQGHIVTGLLHALNYPLLNVRRSRVFAMRDVAFDALRQRGTKLVFVDQAHCLGTQTKPKHGNVLENAATDTLREMMEETGVGLVLLTDGTFQGLELVDRALDDRISVRLKLNHFSNLQDWRGFLSAFAKAVERVDLNILNEIRIAKSTLKATDGNRRTFRRLIVEAVLIAVDDGQRIVTETHLKHAFCAVNGGASTRTNPYAT